MQIRNTDSPSRCRSQEFECQEPNRKHQRNPNSFCFRCLHARCNMQRPSGKPPPHMRKHPLVQTPPGASKTDENVIPTTNHDVFWENTMFLGNTAFSISSIFPYIPSTRHPFSKDLKSIISTSESPIALPFCARNEISFAFATRLSQLESERRRPGTQIVKSTTVL